MDTPSLVAAGGCLYVPCARNPRNGHPAQEHRWAQQVPIVKKTVNLIYYTSDSWSRSQAAEDYLYRWERERAEQAAPQAPPTKELRRAMADAHPDRGGTAEQFIQARRRYQTALRASRGPHQGACEGREAA